MSADGRCVVCSREGSGRRRALQVACALLFGFLALGGFYRSARAPHARPNEASAAEHAPQAPGLAPQAAPKAEPLPADRAAHERRVNDAMRTVDITIYGATWCPSCKAAHKWLDAHSIAYIDKDIEKSDADNRAMRALNPASTIPTLDIEGQVLVGFDPQRIERAIRAAAEKRVPL